MVIPKSGSGELLNDKSREHVCVAKPKSAFDPNAAQSKLRHSCSVVSVQLLVGSFILQ